MLKIIRLHLFCSLLLLAPFHFVVAQDSTVTIITECVIRKDSIDSNSLKEKRIHQLRQKIVGYGSVATYAGLLYVLNDAWYADYPRSSFHFYNDFGEWNQIDKVGHAWAAYQLTNAAYRTWKWAGVSDRKALLYAGVSGPGFMTVIEILDGFSAEWGFSLADMGANVIGSGLFLGQQALWDEQKIQFKFSVHANKYSDPLLSARANELFGKTWNERILKDYNAQTYWLSANLKSFFPNSRLPKWLNFSIGYGAEGMFTGFGNEKKDDQCVTYNTPSNPRVRQFYIAPDIDLSKIKTNNKFLRSVFYTLNCLKFPAPTLMIDSKGKVKGYWLYF